MKIFSTLLFVFVFITSIHAQDKVYNFDELVISAGRTPVSFSNLARSVSLFSKKDIETIPVDNITDLLKFLSGVDLRARGTEGVQADVSIRGGSFEETLIMIDGIKISDPQTGHNSLNLPIALENIERIEVLKGQGGRVFGANAYSGAINIITNKNKNNLVSLSALGGENGLYEFGFSGNYKSGISGSSIFIDRKKSNGYKDNTDFESTNYSLSQNFALSNVDINLFLGYTDKQFGANSFYSDLFPNQYERTLTKFGNVAADINYNQFILSPKFFFRTNFDDYHLDKNRPDWNHNTHHTNSYGGELQLSYNSHLGTTSLGTELSTDEINSTNLGVHNRTKGGLFVEQSLTTFKNIFISVGFFAYNYSSIGWKFSPGIDISYKLLENIKIFTSIGSAIRIPSFTELYYVSPANMGNPNLVREESINYEVGYSFDQNYFKNSGSIFLKRGENLIDWVRVNKTDPWQVENVTKLTTVGFEEELLLNMKKMFTSFPIQSINISYTYLSSDRTASGYESKYLLDHLQHQIITTIVNDLPFGFNQSWIFRYEQRINQFSNFIVDSQITTQINGFNLFIRATNLFNQSYFDVVGVPLPGRWISAGIKFSTKDF